MKNAKRNIIILIIVIVIILIIYALFSHKSLDVKLMRVTGKTVSFYNFSNGKVISMDIEEYCKNNGKTLICTEFKNNKHDIIRITPEGKKIIYKSDTFITSNILEHNEILYFSAHENSTDTFTKTHLYSLKNSAAEKLYEHEVVGNLLQYDNTLIFTDKNSEEIMTYDTETGTFEKLCDGKFPCWKEYGKSIFINTDNKLSILDIKSKEVTHFDTKVIKPVAYNSRKNVLLYIGTDDITTFGHPEGISKLVNLDTGAISYTFKYQSLIQQLLNNDFFNIYGYECEWIY